MADRLHLILAHLNSISPIETSVASFIAKLMNAGCSGATQGETKLQVNTPGMTEAFAGSLVEKLAAAIRVSGYAAGPTFRAANDKAVEAAGKIEGFTRKHPLWTTVIALGILAVMCPPAIKLLGFGLKGVAKGKLSAQVC
jgi:hypothetical protein